jgi:N-acetylglucosamine kinase-like BadF-type ATPase
VQSKYVLAVDGGGTKTICNIVNKEGKILGYGTSGSSSHYAVGLKKARINLKEAIRRAIGEAGLGNKQCDVGCFGMASLDTQKDYDLIFDYIKSLNIIRECYIVSDMVIAYYTVTLGEPGIVVIAGTGSGAYGVNKKGEEARSGGWEWLVGDEGSAFDIARRGLIAFLKGCDGRGQGTILTKMFKAKFGTEDTEYIFRKIYENVDKLSIASYAPIVTLAAQEGDKVALEILNDASRELGLAALAVAKKLRMERDKVTVGGVGGVFISSSLVWDNFISTIKPHMPNATFKPPFSDASLGAIFLGLKYCGISPTTELIENIEKNLKSRYSLSPTQLI